MMHVNLAEKVFRFTQENALFQAGSSIVVGVSGGADSMALLHLLTHPPFEDIYVYAVHVHHGLRGEEADRDAEFVDDYCAKNGIQLHTVHEDVRAMARAAHVGLEEAGRRVRYDALERIRIRLGASYIATAHTASDCAETMLMHLIRGSGTGGLTGIPSKRGNIIRPLLCCTRDEIEAYCAERGVGYITDSTNADVYYTRNRVRCQLMPLLKQINPAAESALMRLRDAVVQDEAYLQSLAADELMKAKKLDGGYDSVFFLRQPQSVRVRMWKTLLVEIGCFAYTEKHICALDHALKINHGTVFLPNGHRVVISADCVKGFDSSELLGEFIWFSIDALPMRFIIAGHEHVLQSVTRDAMNRLQNVHKLFFKYAIDCDKIQGGLCVRRRADGDAFHPAGRRVGKSLKKVFQEQKIPIYQREIYPLLCDEVGVVLMPGVGCDARVCPDDSTKHFLVWLIDGEPSYTVNCLWNDKSVDEPATDFKER